MPDCGYDFPIAKREETASEKFVREALLLKDEIIATLYPTDTAQPSACRPAFLFENDNQRFPDVKLISSEKPVDAAKRAEYHARIRRIGTEKE